MAAQVVSYRRAEMARLAAPALDDEAGENFSYGLPGCTRKHRSHRKADPGDDAEGTLHLHPLCAAQHIRATPSASSVARNLTAQQSPSSQVPPRTTLAPPGEPLTSSSGNAGAARRRQQVADATHKSPRPSDRVEEGLKMHPLCAVQTRTAKARHMSPQRVHSHGFNSQQVIQRSKSDGMGLTQGQHSVPATTQARKKNLNINVVIPVEGDSLGEEGRDARSALTSASPASSGKGSESKSGSASSMWTPRGLFSRQSSVKSSLEENASSKKPSSHNPVKRVQIIDKLAPASRWTGRPPQAPTSRSRFQRPPSSLSGQPPQLDLSGTPCAPTQELPAGGRPETPEMPSNACLNFCLPARKASHQVKTKGSVHPGSPQCSRDLNCDFDPEVRMERQMTVERETWRTEAEFGAEEESEGFLQRRSTAGR